MEPERVTISCECCAHQGRIRLALVGQPLTCMACGHVGVPTGWKVPRQAKAPPRWHKLKRSSQPRPASPRQRNAAATAGPAA
jgi:hypothetical protein